MTKQTIENIRGFVNVSQRIDEQNPAEPAKRLSHVKQTTSQQETEEAPTLVACPDCDLLQKVPEIPVGTAAYCIRCRATLFRYQKNSLDRSLAFALTGLILFVITNLFPILSLKALGIVQEGTILSSAFSLFSGDMPLLGVILLLTTFIFPALTLTGTIVVLLQVKTDRINDYTAPIFRYLRSTDAWGMLEIFMLAVIVAVVKLGDVAEVIPGIALYSFGLLILSMTLLSYSLNPHDVWNKLRDREGCRL